MPIVCVDYQHDEFDSVYTGLARICQHAIDYFMKQGHQRIGFISGQDTGKTIDIREPAFLECGRSRKMVNARDIYRGDFSSASAWPGRCWKKVIHKHFWSPHTPLPLRC